MFWKKEWEKIPTFLFYWSGSVSKSDTLDKRTNKHIHSSLSLSLSPSNGERLLPGKSARLPENDSLPITAARKRWDPCLKIVNGGQLNLMMIVDLMPIRSLLPISTIHLMEKVCDFSEREKFPCSEDVKTEIFIDRQSDRGWFEWSTSDLQSVKGSSRLRSIRPSTGGRIERSSNPSGRSWILPCSLWPPSFGHFTS